VAKYAAVKQPRKGTLFTNPGMLLSNSDWFLQLTPMQVVPVSLVSTLSCHSDRLLASSPADTTTLYRGTPEALA
jgi:hypothetical protein